MSGATTEDIRKMVRIMAEVSSLSFEEQNDEFIHSLVADAVAGFDRWLAEVSREERNAEREGIINDLAADCNHAEPWCYHRDVIKLIRGEDND